MEDRRFIIIYLAIIFSAVATLLLGPSFLLQSFAYSDKTTHPALTQEIVEFFNIYHPEFALNNQEKESVIQGSIDEDAFGRWMRHFYDPIYNKGVNYFGITWQTSKDWANDTIAQATYKIQDFPNRALYGSVKEYFSGDTDYSWDRAVYEYAWGDKKRALRALGHTLHLIEDATVPDHTRDDPHPAYGKRLQDISPNISPAVFELLEHFDDTNDSPYESWTAQFDRSSIGVIGALQKQNAKPIYLHNLGEYFDAVANYSNNNFFSRDTIFSQRYSSPIVLKFFGEIGFARGDEFPLVRKIVPPIWQGGEIEYTLIDQEKLILSSYWSRLSQQAVRNGAGMIKLFFDEAEKERTTKILYNKNKSWFAKAFDATKEKIYNIVNVFYGISAPFNDVNEPANESAVLGAIEDSFKEEQKSPSNQVLPLVNQQENVSINQNAQAQVPISPVPQQQQTNQLFALASPVVNPVNAVPPPAIGGGGGGPATIFQTQTSEDSSGAPPAENPQQDTTPPDPPAILSPADFSHIFTADTIIFSGTAESASIISNDFTDATTTTDIIGAWSLEIELNQATTTIQFFAEDIAGNISEPTSVTLVVDSIAPDLDFTIPECSDSLSHNNCILMPQDITLEWSSPADDIEAYELLCTANGNTCDGFPQVFLENETVLKTSITGTNHVYTFMLTAEDRAGNKKQAEKQVEVFEHPVVINEIAWMGTQNHPEDEWIELYNPTSEAIHFDDSWVLYSETDSSPYISLNGSIPAGGYYLIERKNTNETDEMNESPVKDIAADLWVSFGVGLNNTGEHIKLARASTTIDSVFHCFNWCSIGSNHTKQTMERFDPFASGVDANNWGTNNIVFANGVNTEGVALKATPKAQNSIWYQMVNGSTIESDLTLKKSHGPYLVPDVFFILNEDATLTIEPGVVIKFSHSDSGRFAVRGTLEAKGSDIEPIVFTSFRDDEYGGDFNRDGSLSPPFAGDWRGIIIESSSSDSLIDHGIVRYAGKFYTPALPAERTNLLIDSTDVTVTNSIFAYSRVNGVVLRNSASIIEGNTFYGNSNDNSAFGLLIEGGAPDIIGNTFEMNTTGLRIEDSPNAKVTSNIFIENSAKAVEILGLIPNIASNSGSGNGIGGIIVSGNVIPFGMTTTLLKNELPYVLSGTIPVPDGATLTFESGVVIKGNINPPLGMLRIESGGMFSFNGSSPEDLIFTSLRDDSVGGDTDNSTSSPEAGDWYGIRLEAGGMLDLAGFTLRYAGGPRTGGGGDDRAGITILGSATSASSTIGAALIEKNLQYGIRLADGARITLTDSTLKDHTERKTDKASAVRLMSSHAELENIIFGNNELDISAIGAYSLLCANCGTPKTEPDPL